jgi:hypothetical protein
MQLQHPVNPVNPVKKLSGVLYLIAYDVADKD